MVTTVEGWGTERHGACHQRFCKACMTSFAPPTTVALFPAKDLIREIWARAQRPSSFFGSMMLSMRNSVHTNSSTPLFRAAPYRKMKVVDRTMIRLTLSTTVAGWTGITDYLGPLRIKVTCTV